MRKNKHRQGTWGLRNGVGLEGGGVAGTRYPGASASGLMFYFISRSECVALDAILPSI